MDQALQLPIFVLDALEDLREELDAYAASTNGDLQPDQQREWNNRICITSRSLYSQFRSVKEEISLAETVAEELSAYQKEHLYTVSSQCIEILTRAVSVLTADEAEEHRESVQRKLDAITDVCNSLK